MREFIDKLIERLEEKSFIDYDEYYTDGGECLVSISDVVEIVNQLAEEYKVSEMPTGWIPCSERLPDTEHISGVSESVLVTTNVHSIFTAEYHRNGKWLDDVGDWSLDVIAWQPLPAPFKEGE